MTAPLTIDELLAEVDGLIEAMRHHRGTGSRWERPYVALKQVAKDLRAQRESTITAAEHALAARVLRCRQTERQPEHKGAMMNLANEVVARWGTIRIALGIATRMAESMAKEPAA